MEKQWDKQYIETEIEIDIEENWWGLGNFMPVLEVQSRPGIWTFQRKQVCFDTWLGPP